MNRIFAGFVAASVFGAFVAAGVTGTIWPVVIIGVALYYVGKVFAYFERLENADNRRRRPHQRGRRR